MDKLTGKDVKAWWFDPRTGRSHVVGQFPREGEREFTPPGEPGVGNDWVLALDNPQRGLGPPRVSLESFSHLSIASAAIDTAAALVTAVRDGAEGATIEIAPGTFELEAPLELKAGMTLKGAGMDKTILTHTAAWKPSTKTLPDPEMTTKGMDTQAYLIRLKRQGGQHHRLRPDLARAATARSHLRLGQHRTPICITCASRTRSGPASGRSC